MADATDPRELALRLLRPDRSARGARELLGDPARLASAFTLLRAFGSRLEPRRRAVLERALGVRGAPESLAAIGRELDVSRVRAHALFRRAVDELVQEASGGEPLPVRKSGALAVARAGDATGDAIAWSRLDPRRRRVRAVKAAREHDGEALWSLTNYVLTTRGRRRARISERTRRAYRRGVLDLVEAFAEEDLLRPSSDAGAVYLIRLETEPITRTLRGRTVTGPRAPATVAVKLAAAKALYRALRHVGATDATPFQDLSAPGDDAAPEGKREAYTAAEVAALLRHADPVDRVFVHLCATAGLRNAEATSLTWSQVRVDEGVLASVVGKGGRVRDVPAARDLLEALAAQRPAGAGAQAPVLPFGPERARVRLRRLCERAGVRYVGREVHGLRHTAGTEVTRAYGIDAAADLLRHANLQTTRRYSKRTAAERRAITDRLAGGYREHDED